MTRSNARTAYKPKTTCTCIRTYMWIDVVALQRISYYKRHRILMLLKLKTGHVLVDLAIGIVRVFVRM